MGRLDLYAQPLALPSALAVAITLASLAPQAFAACGGSGDATVRSATAGPCDLAAPGTLNITQTGAITATGAPAVQADGIQGAVSVANAGTLAGAAGVSVINSQLSGGVVNYSAGQILGNAPSSSGVTVAGSRLTDGLVNNGLIQSGASAGWGVDIHGSIVGAVRNRGTIDGAVYGLQTLESTVNGSVVNNGSITSRYAQALAISNSQVNGDVVSSGRLRAGSFALAVTSSTVTGDVRGAGHINGASAGVRVAYSRVGGSVLTAGTVLSSAGVGVEVTNSRIAGDVANQATVTAADGMLVNGRVAGNVLNSGQINARDDGLGLYSATVRGLLQNSGSITVQGGVVQTEGPQAALGVHFNSTVGGLSNTGTLRSEGSAAIQVDNAVINRRGVRNLGDASGHIGIDIATAAVAGGIVNTGSLDALDNTEGSTGIRVSNSQVSGGLVNSGSIRGNAAAISLDASTLSGNVNNSGTLSTEGYGIGLVNASVLDGNLQNSGSIRSDGSIGVRVRNAQVTGNLANSGQVYGFDDGIAVNQLTLGGVLSNSGSLISHGNALTVENSTLGGGISNTGTFDAPNGVVISGSTLGGFTNRGQVLGGSDGVFSLFGSHVTGDVVNSGRMVGAGDTAFAWLTQNTQVDGKVSNSGTIQAVNGITVVNSRLAGGLDISGAVLGDQVGGYSVYIDEASQVPLIRLLGQGTVNLRGTLYAPATEVRVPQGSSVTLQDANLLQVPVLTNQGNLAVAAQGYSLDAPNGPPHAGIATVQGDYTQAAGATFTTEVVDGEHYGHLVVTGTATLPSQAKLYVDVSNPGQPFSVSRLNDVISAGTLVSDGTYQVASNSQLFTFNGVKDGNSVDLALAAKTPSGASTAVAGNRRAEGAARVLDAQFSGGASSSLAPYFVSATNTAQVASAVQQSLPLTHTLAANQFVQAQLIDSVRDRLQASTYQAATAFSPGTSGVWLKPFGAQLAPSQGGGALASVAGTLMGADALISTDTRVGVALAYGNSGTGANLGGGGQRARMELYQFTAYASHRLDAITEFSAHAGMGNTLNQGQRTLDFGGSAGQAQSRFDSQALNTGVALSRHYAVSETTQLTPSLTADYLRIHEAAYRESGAASLNPLLLDVQARDTDQLLLGFDTRLAHDLGQASQFKVRMGVAYDVLQQPNEVTASYAGAPGQRFTTRGDDLGAWVLAGGLAFTTQSRAGTALSLSWDAQARSGLAQQVARVQVSRAF